LDAIHCKKRTLRTWFPLSMKAPKEMLLPLGIVSCLMLAACQPQQATPKGRAVVYRLFDLFQPEDLVGKVSPEDAGWKSLEWHVQDMVACPPPPPPEGTNAEPAAKPAAAIGFRSLKDVAELKISGSQLVGDIIGGAPVLDFTLRDNHGGAES